MRSSGWRGAKRVGPALREQALVALAALGLQQRVLQPRARVVDVEVGGHDVVVAGEHHRMAARLAAPPRARSAARTTRACSRTWGRAAGCRWAGRGSRRRCRRPPPRCSGSGRRRDRPAARAGSRSAPRPWRGSRRRSTSAGRARSRRSPPRGSPRWETPSSAFSSCRQATSGDSCSSHWSRWGRRERMPLTLKVAIFIVRAAPPQKSEPSLRVKR